MAEDDGRDIIIICFALDAGEQTIRQAPPGSNGHGRELDVAADVAQGIDAFRRRVLEVVDGYISVLLIQLDAGLV